MVSSVGVKVLSHLLQAPSDKVEHQTKERDRLSTSAQNTKLLGGPKACGEYSLLWPLGNWVTRSMERLRLDLRSGLLTRAPLQQQRSSHLPPGWHVQGPSKNPEVDGLCQGRSGRKGTRGPASAVEGQVSKLQAGLSTCESKHWQSLGIFKLHWLYVPGLEE